MKNDYFKGFKLFKIIQLIILVIFALAFFLNIYLDEDMRVSVYTNRSLLTICVFLWAFMLYSVVCIILDYYQLEGHIAHDNSLNRAVYTDSLTGIPNRFGCDMIFQEYTNGKDISKIGCGLIEIANLDDINRKKGRANGNVALVNFSRMIERVGSHYGFVGRNNGNEFLVVIDNCDEVKFDRFIDELGKETGEYNQLQSNDNIELSYNYLLNERENIADFTELISKVYEVSRG